MKHRSAVLRGAKTASGAGHVRFQNDVHGAGKQGKTGLVVPTFVLSVGFGAVWGSIRAISIFTACGRR